MFDKKIKVKLAPGYSVYNDPASGESIDSYDINGIEMTPTLNVLKAIEKKILIVVL